MSDPRREGVDPHVSDWLIRLAWSGREDADLYPAIAAAMTGSTGAWVGAETLARLTGCGWSKERLNAALTRAHEHTPKWNWNHPHDPTGNGEAMRRMAQLSHLSPDEFDAWSAAFGHDLVVLTEAPTLLAIDVWRAVLPGALAPYCAAAGMTPDEAAAMYATGVLTEDGLATLIALQQGAAVTDG